MINLINIPTIGDERGILGYLEAQRQIPFSIKRIFYLYDIKPGQIRGDHVHKELYEFLIAMKGSVDIWASDGKNAQTFTLSSPQQGLLAPPMHWLRLENFSPDAVCLVLASDIYRDEDYIRDYDQFLRLVQNE